VQTRTSKEVYVSIAQTLRDKIKDSQPHLSFWKDHRAHFHELISKYVKDKEIISNS